MDEIQHFLSIWWRYLFYASLSFVVLKVVVAFYHRLENWLDRRHADDLPQFTGEWVRSQIAARGLSDRLSVVVWPDAGKHAVDCYAPNEGLILLSDRTFFKNDPTFWAAGAHELGHALIRERAAGFAALLHAAMRAHGLVVGLASSFLFVNILYGYPGLGEIGLWLMWASVGLSAVGLVDEALASTIAMSMLRRDAHLDRKGWLGALVGLLGAFSTYLASLITHAIVISQYDSIIRIAEVEANFVAAGELTGWQFYVAAVLAGLLLLSVVPALIAIVFGDAVRSALLGVIFAMVTVISLTFFLYLVWDQPLGPGFATCVALAARPVFGLVAVVVLLPLILFGLLKPLTYLARALLWLPRLLSGSQAEERAQSDAGKAAAKRAREGREAELRRGVEALDKAAELERSRALDHRLAELGRLFYIPVVLYWIFA